jgi:antitoxin ParD1/3/4
MATMNVSLPNPMKSWVESQSKSGKYSNSSDYVRDLIRQDQIRAEKTAHIQKLVTEGLESGITKQTPDEILAEARKLANAQR